MKKLLMFVSVVLLGTIANAAAVNWGGAVAAADGETALSSGSTAFLFWSATDVGSALGGTLTIDGDTYKLSNASGDALEATMVQQHVLTTTELTNYEFAEAYNKAGSDVNGYYNVIVVDGTPGNGSNFTAYYTSISGTTAMSSPSDIKYNTGWNEGYDKFLGDAGYAGTVGEGGGGIPEPTSGLLLLIGGSLLALRRKQK